MHVIMALQGLTLLYTLAPCRFFSQVLLKDKAGQRRFAAKRFAV